MYFPLYEPYLLENNNTDCIEFNINNIEYDVCIICLEKKDSIKVKTLIESKKYNINCECNYYIHPYCLNQWIIIKNNCPICKCIFQIKICNKEFKIDKYIKNFIVLFIFLCNVGCLIIFFSLLLLIIF